MGQAAEARSGWAGSDVLMTDMVAIDLQDMAEHPVRSAVLMALSMLLTLVCFLGYPVLLLLAIL